MRNYESNVQCYDREFEGGQCQATLSSMSISGNPMYWRPEGAIPASRPNIFVPKWYSDRTFPDASFSSFVLRALSDIQPLILASRL